MNHKPLADRNPSACLEAAPPAPAPAPAEPEVTQDYPGVTNSWLGEASLIGSLVQG